MEKVTVVFWDVQHGNAVYINTPNNRHIVIDLGTGSYGDNNLEFSPLLHLKNKWNINQLDYVIITHPHRDHIDDILNFEKLFPNVLLKPSVPKEVIEDLLSQAGEKDKPKFEKYLKLLENYTAPVSSENDPSNPNNYGGLVIRSYFTTQCAPSNINNYSIITVISFAGRKIVFTGDNESCSLNKLLENENFKEAVKNADILLAPHHGRESGFHSEFVSLANPKLTVVSDGRFCDSSASSRYSEKSRGMIVKKRSNGKREKRYCVTTRKDGCILVEFGYNEEGKTFMEATIN
jgi:competence protein ComEC